MNLQELIVLLPCNSLEDLTLHRDAREAEELLSAWSALYHPALLAGVGKVPRWGRAQSPPEELAGSLIMLPGCSAALVPAGWPQQAREAGASIISDLEHRNAMVAAALERLDTAPPNVDSQLVADFLALGFCHFQVELLTRQLRYMSNLDEEGFRREAVAAAEEALKGEEQAARDRLRSAFDLLTEAREYFYPVETRLLDLTLIAPTTLGESLRAELALPGPTNLLISGRLVDEIARREPATLAALKEAIENQRATIIGGEFDEQELPLLPVEAILAQFKRGLDSYQRHLGQRPKIFGRRRFGLTPVLPQILRGLGFDGVLHFTLDDGRFPTGNQSKIRWEGVDATAIEALVRLPLDATCPEHFLSLPEKLGDAMDLDHAATAVFAHWPGQESPWYHDLRRMAEYAPVLGRFALVDSYFQDTQYVGQVTRHSADQYRSPYLRQAVAAGQADPISRWVRYHRRRAAADVLEALAMMTRLIGGGEAGRPESRELLDEVEDSRATASSDDTALDDRLHRGLEEAMGRFSAALPRQKVAAEKGWLLANPGSFPRRLCLDLSGLERLPVLGGPIRALGEADGRKEAVVEVPPMGFAWVGPAAADSPSSGPVEKKQKRKWRKNRKDEEPAVAEENVLRNEFFEVTINPTTGGVKSIYDYATRGNRLAQQLALRLPRPRRPRQDGPEEDDPEKDYSLMAADEVLVTSSGPVVGEIVSRGRLVDRDGQRLARFVQTVVVRRGSRVMELGIDLEVEKQPGPDPWNSYYAARFAWGDATADLYRGVSLASQPTDTPQTESPHFIDVRTEKTRTTILTGGLPYHRRFGLRKLDTLLVVRNETARSFRLGIGVDLMYPVAAGLDFLAPHTVLQQQAAPPPGGSGWFFHLDAKNVLATHWEPLISDQGVKGFRVRLLETEGRRCRAGLRSFRPIESARKIGFQDGPEEQPTELSVEDDRVTMDIGAHEWIQVEVDFTR